MNNEDVRQMLERMSSQEIADWMLGRVKNAVKQIETKETINELEDYVNEE